MTRLPDEVLGAVLNAPDADAPRRAAAEWYDGRDPARARFIRDQLALAALAVRGGPDEYRLRQDAEQALHAHGARWAAELGLEPDAVGWDRGFIELAALEAPRIAAELPALRTRAPIRHVDGVGAADDWAALLAAPVWDGVRSIKLDRCGVDDAAVQTLAEGDQFAALRWLSLAENGITRAGVEAIARSSRLPQLAWVDLSGNPFTPNEQYAFDGHSGAVVDRWMPPDGESLEAEFGRLPWLRFDARSVSRTAPDRFRC